MSHHFYALAAAHLEWVLYALPLLVGALPDVLALLQRRGLGRRRGLGSSGRRRRSRSGGFLGALGALALFFVLGPLVLLALAAYAAYRFAGRRRGR